MSSFILRLGGFDPISSFGIFSFLSTFPFGVAVLIGGPLPPDFLVQPFQGSSTSRTGRTGRGLGAAVRQAGSSRSRPLRPRRPGTPGPPQPAFLSSPSENLLVLCFALLLQKRTPRRPRPLAHAGVAVGRGSPRDGSGIVARPRHRHAADIHHRAASDFLWGELAPVWLLASARAWALRSGLGGGAFPSFSSLSCSSRAAAAAS